MEDITGQPSKMWCPFHRQCMIYLALTYHFAEARNRNTELLGNSPQRSQPRPKWYVKSAIIPLALVRL